MLTKLRQNHVIRTPDESEPVGFSSDVTDCVPEMAITWA